MYFSIARKSPLIAPDMPANARLLKVDFMSENVAGACMLTKAIEPKAPAIRPLKNLNIMLFVFVMPYSIAHYFNKVKLVAGLRIERKPGGYEPPEVPLLHPTIL